MVPLAIENSRLVSFAMLNVPPLAGTIAAIKFGSEHRAEASPVFSINGREANDYYKPCRPGSRK
jgi:hypothetical protein